jgi:DNA-binding transcriptional ArsR family regulator
MKMTMTATALTGLAAKADEAAAFLKLLANEQRLLVLCHLVGDGEMSVNALADQLELSQSALSQHLARLREDGLVTYRREAQTLYYRVSDRRVITVMKTLKRAFCP